jgi:hypothetical protein
LYRLGFSTESPDAVMLQHRGGVRWFCSLEHAQE